MNRMVAAAVCLILFASCASTPHRTKRELTPASDPVLASELSAMLKEDQELRERWVRDAKNEAIREEVRALSKRHIARLEQILAVHGWPKITLVGFNGMSAMWTIAQHGGKEFLGRVLPLMYEAVRSGDLDASLYALSFDRVLIQQGKNQLYGSQFDIDAASGKCLPKPIDDPQHVDERRRRAGMEPLADYTKELCEAYLQPQVQK